MYINLYWLLKLMGWKPEMKLNKTKWRDKVSLNSIRCVSQLLIHYPQLIRLRCLLTTLGASLQTIVSRSIGVVSGRFGPIAEKSTYGLLTDKCSSAAGHCDWSKQLRPVWPKPRINFLIFPSPVTTSRGTV